MYLLRIVLDGRGVRSSPPCSDPLVRTEEEKSAVARFSCQLAAFNGGGGVAWVALVSFCSVAGGGGTGTGVITGEGGGDDGGPTTGGGGGFMRVFSTV